MLAVESLTEAVSFLPLYDLDSVLLANRQLSSIASKCVKWIRVWDFEIVSVTLSRNLMVLVDGDDVTRVFTERREFANLLEIALHNSRIECLNVTLSPMDVLQLPTKSALQVGELHLVLLEISSSDSLADVLSRLRKVQVVHLYWCDEITDFSPLIDLCRQKGVRRVINESNGADLMADQ